MITYKFILGFLGIFIIFIAIQERKKLASFREWLKYFIIIMVAVTLIKLSV